MSGREGLAPPKATWVGHRDLGDPAAREPREDTSPSVRGRRACALRVGLVHERTLATASRSVSATLLSGCVDVGQERGDAIEGVLQNRPRPRVRAADTSRAGHPEAAALPPEGGRSGRMDPIRPTAAGPGSGSMASERSVRRSVRAGPGGMQRVAEEDERRVRRVRLGRGEAGHPATERMPANDDVGGRRDDRVEGRQGVFCLAPGKIDGDRVEAALSKPRHERRHRRRRAAGAMAQEAAKAHSDSVAALAA